MFRQRVIAALAAYEAGATSTGESELAEAQRIRQQAVHMAERMLRDVMGSSDDATGGIETWQDAVMLRAVAEEEMEYAREESRRLPAMATAERDEMRAKYARERKALRQELHNELEVSRAAALDEAERIRQAAEVEATNVISEAIGKVDQARNDARDELHRSERRLAILRTALADAESRFRRLAATAANEAGTLAALADQDVAADGEAQHLEAVLVDLTADGPQETDGSQEADVSVPVAGESPINRDPDAGFYQRRLAGLRDRLEKSGHPPE